jgi:hypothetical protein
MRAKDLSFIAKINFLPFITPLISLPATTHVTHANEFAKTLYTQRM